MMQAGREVFGFVEREIRPVRSNDTLGAHEQGSWSQAGLQAGDPCICVVHSTDPSAVLSSLRADIGVDTYVASHQLDVHPSSEASVAATSPYPRWLISTRRSSA